MKSTKIEKKNFSLDDFEKGLMLGGYLMPKSVEEMNERDALEQYEKEVGDKKPIKNVYFKRVVLAAEIVAKLHDEPTLGRIKFQKLVYLCEHIGGMELENRYKKQAAGPFDNKFMHSVKTEFEKNGWFSVIKVESKGYSRSKYIPLENKDGYRQYYEKYFGDVEDSKIQYVINLFRKQSTDFTELTTTLLACILEIQSKGEVYKFEKVISLFYAWSEKKQRFNESQVRESLIWLQEKKLLSEIVVVK